MKSINIAELKNHLSRYLRRVRRGERFIVLDRKEPVAELAPPPAAAQDPDERLIREGKVRAPTKRLADLKITPLGREVRVQDLLDAVREDIV